ESRKMSDRAQTFSTRSSSGSSPKVGRRRSGFDLIRQLALPILALPPTFFSRFSGSLRRVGAALLWTIGTLTPVTLGDIPLPPVSSDFDAEFARAADSLETNQREEARALLEELRGEDGSTAART